MTEVASDGGQPLAGGQTGFRETRLNRLAVFYVVVLLAVVYGMFAFKTRQSGIFACPASKYNSETYLAYCEAPAYGDYDHGAAWYGLETIVRQNATSADVLFVGSSRLQFALSAPAVESWFANAHLKYYLFGFSHFENATFLAPLLADLHPRARAVVINVDDFFVPTETGPGADVMHGAKTRARYVQKKLWQAPHKLLCRAWEGLCGSAVAYFRRRTDGFWSWTGTRGVTPSDVGVENAASQADPDTLAYAKRFIGQLGVDQRCVFLSYVPARENRRASAATLATALGYDLLSPRLPDLRTFDSSHLDQASADRFADAFMQTLGPRLSSCLSAS